jgi:putative transport protein
VHLGDVSKLLPAGVQVSSVRRTITTAARGLAHAAPGDGLLIVAERQEAIGETRAVLGRSIRPARQGPQRSLLPALLRLQAGLTGVPLADCRCRGRSAPVMHLRRYDVDIVPPPELMLEIGDRVGLLVPRSTFRRRALLRRHRQGDGGVQLHLGRPRHGAGRAAGPGADPLAGRRHGDAGHRRRPLIVALIVGRLRRTGPISWVMPLTGQHCPAQISD